jgi:hypothetical protein
MAGKPKTSVLSLRMSAKTLAAIQHAKGDLTGQEFALLVIDLLNSKSTPINIPSNGCPNQCENQNFDENSSCLQEISGLHKKLEEILIQISSIRGVLTINIDSKSITDELTTIRSILSGN